MASAMAMAFGEALYVAAVVADGAVALSTSALFESALPLYMAGWYFFTLGLFGLLNGRKGAPDGLLVVDCVHALLSLFTLGNPNIADQQVRDIHCSYHAVYVLLSIALEPSLLSNKGFSAYTVAAWLQMLSALYMPYLDPQAISVAEQQAAVGADTLTTPWHWCLYNFVGSIDIALPLVAYVAYRGVVALIAYPQAMVPAVRATLSTPVAHKTKGVRVLVALVPMFNYVVMWLCIIPRILRFLKHAADFVDRVLDVITGQNRKAKIE